MATGQGQSTPATCRAGDADRHTLRVHAPSPVADRSHPPAAERDVALDLLRGLAMVILVVNHIGLDSALGYATDSILSAAEVLVGVSGIVAGMVFGRRWLAHGPRATTRMLLLRARKLYLATVGVIVVIGALTLAPGVPTGSVTASPSMAPDADLYAFDGPLRTVIAIVTLEAGPWQFSILGLFVVLLLVTPAILWALERGWWPAVLAISWMLFAAGRAWPVEVLPTQSERAFPILIWQALFVHGVVLGYHRGRVAAAIAAHRSVVVGAILAGALIAVSARVGLGPQWEAEHFDKTRLDAARIAAMGALAAAVYLGLRHRQQAAQRLTGWLLLPLGRNSLYVFIMHVFLCLAVALLFGLGGAGLGPAANTLIELACLAALCVMVRRRFLFAVVPR